MDLVLWSSDTVGMGERQTFYTFPSFTSKGLSPGRAPPCPWDPRRQAPCCESLRPVCDAAAHQHVLFRVQLCVHGQFMSFGDWGPSVTPGGLETKGKGLL